MNHNHRIGKDERQGALANTRQGSEENKNVDFGMNLDLEMIQWRYS